MTWLTLNCFLARNKQSETRSIRLPLIKVGKIHLAGNFPTSSALSPITLRMAPSLRERTGGDPGISFMVVTDGL